MVPYTVEIMEIHGKFIQQSQDFSIGGVWSVLLVWYGMVNAITDGQGMDTQEEEKTNIKVLA